MWDKPRIFPILAVAAAALFILKCVSVWTDWGSALDAVSSARAAAPDSHASEEGAASPLPATAKDEAVEPAPSASTPANESDSEKAEASESASDNEAAPADASAAEASTAADPTNGLGESLQFTRAEVEVLQNLSARRAELDTRARELDLKEKLLAASEQRVSERIAALKSIESNIQTLLAARDDAENGQLKSLVKVYENMKPKDAARIFEELDMDILLPVAQHMKEVKFAAILAQMQPDKAKRLTVGLAKQLDLPEQKAIGQKG